MQTLIIAGTVGRDAELRFTQSQEPVLNFSIAVDNGKDRDGNKRDATWFDCSLWGKRAQSLASHIRKGDKLTVSGRPTGREHNGKVYLGCNVSDLSFQGGGKRESTDAGGYNDQPSGQAGGYAGGPDDMNDEVPF